MKLEPRHERPLRRLRQLEERFGPDVWNRLARFREQKGRPPLPDWPAWCYLPIAAGFAVATDGRPDIDYEQRLSGALWGAPLVGLAAWRITKGIWDYDEALYRHLWDTPIDGELPVELLYRLPEWCPYLCLREPGLHGVWAWLEWDANTGRPELRLVLDTDRDDLPGWILHLDQPTLEQCLAAADRETRRQVIEHMPAGEIPLAEIEAANRAGREMIPRLLSLLLYLCSSEPDLTRPMPPAPGAGRRVSPRPQQQPTLWPVGLRIGAALRDAERAEREAGGGSHASPRPHMRRAHWHRYRVGEGRASLALRWVAPVAVGAGDTPAVVRPVAPQ